MNKRLILPIMLLLLVAACAEKQDLVHKAFADKNFDRQLEKARQEEPKVTKKEEEKKEETKIEVLVDNIVEAKDEESVFNKTGSVDRIVPDIFKNNPEAPLLNFEDAKLYDVIYSLCELLGVNFIIDPSIKDQTVTINMVRSDQKLLTSDLFDLLLKLHDLTYVQHDSFISVIPIASPDVNPGLQLLRGNKPNHNLRREEVVMQIIPLRYVAAAEMNAVIKEFLSTSARVYEEPKNNVLIIVDKYQHISKAMELIPIFDIDALANKKMVFYQLAHVDATETASKLTEILGAYGYESEGESLSLVPIETLNGLLVVASNSAIFKELDFWVAKFDKDAQYEEDQIFIYKVENTTAYGIADTISQIFEVRTGTAGGGRANQGASNRRSSSVGGTNSRNNSGSNNRIGQDNNRNSTGANNRGGQNNSNTNRGGLGTNNSNRNNQNSNRRSGGLGGGSQSGEGPLMIVDEDNNSLIFSTTHREYTRFYKTLRELDVLPRQVFLEVTVLSVSLSDTMNMGLNWNWNGTDTDVLGREQNVSGGFPGESGGTGFTGSYTYKVATGMLAAQVNALKSNGYANLLQQPHIMAIDNQSASISVGTDIPIQTSTTNLGDIAGGNSSTPASTSNIQYRSTGVSLSFTPHINANGVIRLEISLDISDPGNVSGAGAPPISSNSLQTEMIVRDSQTIVMGGLILDQEGWSKETVPLLGRIPLIKHLFTDRSANNKKSELIVMITPRLVDSEEKSISISKEFKEKILREFDSFKKSGY